MEKTLSLEDNSKSNTPSLLDIGKMKRGSKVRREEEETGNRTSNTLIQQAVISKTLDKEIAEVDS
jgi:hypothetical protein